MPGDRPHSQPPPTPPRQRIVSATTSNPAAVVGVPLTGGDNEHNHLSTCSLPNQSSVTGDLFASSTPKTLSPASSVSPSLSLSSLSSRGSVYSTATNGFAFIPPEEYAPYGAAFQVGKVLLCSSLCRPSIVTSILLQPEKRIAVGPVTDTYRQRLTAHQYSKETDRRLDQRLSQKYNLLESDTVSTADDLTLTRRPLVPANRAELVDRVSLPVAIVLPSKSQPSSLTPSGHHSSIVDRCERRSSLHRRTCSESSKDRRAGAYVHVKGKRKAPNPPVTNSHNNSNPIAANHLLTPSVTLSPMSTLARRKRQAPAPPASPTPGPDLVAVSTTSAVSSPNNNGDTVCLFNDDEIQAIMAGDSAAVLSAMERSVVSPSNLSATDTLKLEHGMLQHTDNVSMSPPTSPRSPESLGAPLAMVDAATSPLSPISPRPWYKRSSANSRDREAIPFKREIALKTMEKRKNKSKSSNDDSDASKLPDISYSRSSSMFDGFFARVSKQTAAVAADSTSGVVEKRRSAIGMPNISELDREAAEIIRMEEETTAQRLAANASAQMHDKYFEFPADIRDHVALPDASSAASSHRTSTKQLISRFEETNPIRRTANVDNAIINKYFADSAAPATTATVAAASSSLKTPINVDDASSSRSRSSSSTRSANASAGALTRNRALSPSTPSKPARSATAAPTTVTSTASQSTSIMQRIFSSNAGGHNSAPTVEPSAPQRSDTKNTILINVGASTITSTTSAITTTTTRNSPITSTKAAPEEATVDPEIPAATMKWICTYCTLENYNWRVICEVCERMRPFPKPESTIGPTGELVPVPRFRYSAEKRMDDAVAERVVAAAPHSASTSAHCSSGNATDATTAASAASSHKACLIDSSAVVVTTTPQVFIAPLPAKHNEPRRPTTSTDTDSPLIVAQSVPNLDAIRAARIEKFSHETTSQSAQNKKQSTPPLPQLSVCNDKPALLTDRGSLEREKQRLREMIREMNAHALAEKYPVRETESPESTAKMREINSKALVDKNDDHRLESSEKKPNTQPTVLSSVQSQTVLTTSMPVRIPVGRGALRKIPLQRKNESPEDKIISDTSNYIFDVAMKKGTDTKSTKGAFGTSPPLGPIHRRQSLHDLPSPIAELSIEEALLSSGASGPNSPTTQQRMVDEQIDSIYAKLKSNNSGRNTAVSQQTITRGLDDFKSATQTHIGRRPTDTLALNKLLKNLEHAIGKGEHELAATLAMDLARMKVSLTVTKQQQTPAEQDAADGKITNILTDTANEDEGATALPTPLGNESDRTNADNSNSWICPLCTLINDHDRPGCAVCSETRPVKFHASVVNTSNSTTDPQTPVKLRPIVTNSPHSNDLNKTSINRRSAEMFNIIIGPPASKNENIVAKPTNAPAAPKLNKQTIIAAAAVITPSPNITRTKYRGVDNYNPQVNKKAIVPDKSTASTPSTRKASTPYKSPLSRTNGGVKITAVTLKTGENIPVPVGAGAINKIRLTSVIADTNKAGAAATANNGGAAFASSTYNELLNLDNCSLVPNTGPFECAVCFDDIAVAAGVVLRDCLHQFCRECLAQTVRYSDEAEVRCPYMDEAYSCDSSMQEREIRGLLSRDEYERHLAVSLSVAELRESNAFHCKTPGCRGWCIYEDNVNEFRCPICKITNCLTCRVSIPLGNVFFNVMHI